MILSAAHLAQGLAMSGRRSVRRIPKQDSTRLRVCPRVIGQQSLCRNLQTHACLHATRYSHEWARGSASTQYHVCLKHQIWCTALGFPKGGTGDVKNVTRDRIAANFASPTKAGVRRTPKRMRRNARACAPEKGPAACTFSKMECPAVTSRREGGPTQRWASIRRSG
jgi:hypothetical protein